MPDLSTARAITTRRGILQAAADEWSATGEVEVAAVARRAGVSAGLPYRYFGTRSGLVIALVEDFFGRLETSVGMRQYPAATFVEREHQRIIDWIAFLYAEPLSSAVLTGPVGDGAVIAAHSGWLKRLGAVGARNIAHAQASGEVPHGRDPLMLATATLSGVHAMSALALSLQPRPPAEQVVDEVWNFVAGALGVSEWKEGGP